MLRLALPGEGVCRHGSSRSSTQPGKVSVAKLLRHSGRSLRQRPESLVCFLVVFKNNGALRATRRAPELLEGDLSSLGKTTVTAYEGVGSSGNSTCSV